MVQVVRMAMFVVGCPNNGPQPCCRSTGTLELVAGGWWLLLSDDMLVAGGSEGGLQVMTPLMHAIRLTKISHGLLFLHWLPTSEPLGLLVCDTGTQQATGAHASVHAETTENKHMS